MFELDSVSVALWNATEGNATEGNATDGQRVIDAWWAQDLHGARAIIAEGGWGALNAPEHVALRHISAGCVCCAGQVVLRVQLTQLLRELRPRHLLLLLSPSTHTGRLRTQLQDGSLGFRAIEVLGGADNGS